MRRKHEQHGGTANGQRARLYRIWRGILNRCLDKNCNAYAGYGDRGISVCQEWFDSFAAFRSWAGANGYEDNLTIDRIDVNGHYEPGNCRWVTMQVQSENRRNNKLIEIDGVTKTVKAWADEFGLPPKTLYYRHEQGLSANEICSPGRIKTRSKIMIEIDGASRNAREWSEVSGIPMRTIYYRFNHGVTGKALLAPAKNLGKKTPRLC